jgi:hypothetical protein
MPRLATLLTFLYVCALACSKDKGGNNHPIPPTPPKDSSLVNEAHLDHLYIPVSFPDGTQAAGIYIYSQYPDYILTEASGEGYTCVDDVSRAALYFARCPDLLTDTTKQSKLLNLMQFVVKMQSPSGYFYNFLQTGGSINMFGPTSAANPNWWSWRALQTLTEVLPVMRQLNPAFAGVIDLSIQKLLAVIKSDFIPLPKTTTVFNGVTIPTWLPAGSGTDQGATLLLGLINYVSQNPDTAIISLIRKMSDGLMQMQKGDSSNYPYGMILSFQNNWHAYGADQPFALLSAGDFLHDVSYQNAGFRMIDDYYSWFLANEFKSLISVNEVNPVISQISGNNYEQIAYSYRPMVSASVKAFQLSDDPKYADLAGRLASWFSGNNDASSIIYDPVTGICFDAISTGNNVNRNSGAESTIEALLTFEMVEANAAVKTAYLKFKK